MRATTIEADERADQVLADLDAWEVSARGSYFRRMPLGSCGVVSRSREGDWLVYLDRVLVARKPTADEGKAWINSFARNC